MSKRIAALLITALAACGTDTGPRACSDLLADVTQRLGTCTISLDGLETTFGCPHVSTPANQITSCSAITSDAAQVGLIQTLGGVDGLVVAVTGNATVCEFRACE